MVTTETSKKAAKEIDKMPSQQMTSRNASLQERVRRGLLPQMKMKCKSVQLFPSPAIYLVAASMESSA